MQRHFVPNVEVSFAVQDAIARGCSVDEARRALYGRRAMYSAPPARITFCVNELATTNVTRAVLAHELTHLHDVSTAHNISAEAWAQTLPRVSTH